MTCARFSQKAGITSLLEHRHAEREVRFHVDDGRNPKKTFRRNADDCDRAPVNHYGLVENVRIAVEARLPVSIAQDHDRVGARHVPLRRQNKATEIGMNAE